MTPRRADGTRVPLRYLSFWVRHADGWRVAANKRRPRAEGEVSQAMLAPSAFPFFTVWRRTAPNDAWRYVAE